MLQIFRVAGIPVRVDASWLLVFALIWFLPDLTPAAAWLDAATAAALLFASVFLHELSHVVVARGNGMGVGSIRLHVFGGVSELPAAPPRAEFLIAAVGPLTSFAIAAVCYGLGRTLAGNAWAAALTGYLTAINLIVGLVNLVPGLPLDGGRLLRAMLWRWSGRVEWATRWAGRAGSLFAVFLIGLGALRAAVGELTGGLWFIVIGLFLRHAARASVETASPRDLEHAA